MTALKKPLLESKVHMFIHPVFTRNIIFPKDLKVHLDSSEDVEKREP